MTTTTCGWCRTVAYMRAVSPFMSSANVADYQSAFQAAFACDNCGRLSLAIDPEPGFPSSGQVEGQDYATTYQWSPEVTWLPQPEQRRYPDVPPHIAHAATETALCLTSGAYRAVGSLARAVIEAVAKDKKITTGKLYNKIEALTAAGHLRPHTAQVAHEIRHFGNDMAHGDFTEPITRDEAAVIIDLMSEVLQEVYQGPARIARVRQAREAKKTTDQTTTT